MTFKAPPYPSAAWPRSASWLATAIVAAIIIYGSLYPFHFRHPTGELGLFVTFLHSVADRPGRIDIIANILLYVPLGFFVVMGLRHRSAAALFAATAAATLLSLCVELAQYYDAGRVTSLSDVVTNTLGALLGGLAALAIGARLRVPLLGSLPVRPVPAILLLAWLAYRLYPYVPAVHLHKYWDALRPILLAPSLTGADLFRHAAAWLTICALLEALIGGRRSAWLAPPFAIAVLCAKVVIIGGVLRLAEPVGAALAYAIWLVLLRFPSRVQAGLTGIVLCAAVVAWRLEPFAWLPVPRAFGWLPFRGLLHGAMHTHTLLFLEKFFLYGSIVYLLGTAVGRLLPAALFTAVVLLATGWAETWLPGRSGEITDALIALIAAALFALLPRDTRATAPSGARHRSLDGWQRT